MISFVLSNPYTDNCYSRVSGAHCTLVGQECWCYYYNVGGWLVCGYPNGYDGKYYSIALDSATYGGTIIKRLGQTTYGSHCNGDDDCDQNSIANYCSGSSCYGTSLNPSYDEKTRWEKYSPITGNGYEGIVRCIDQEGMVYY